MNLCHNRYGKIAEYMVKCQQKVIFMRVYIVCTLISLYGIYLISPLQIFSLINIVNSIDKLLLYSQYHLFLDSFVYKQQQ